MTRGSLTRWVFIWGDVTGIGGTERRMAEAAVEMRAQGVEVISLVHSSVTASDFVSLMKNSCSEVTISNSWLALWRSVPWHASRTVIFAFGLRPSMASRLLSAWGSSRPIVLVARNGLDFSWARWMHVIDKVTSGLVDAYVANSAAVERHLRRWRLMRPIHVVRSALDSEWAQPLNPTRLSRPSVIMVGNARPEKNQIAGIEAFVASGIDATLTVYTDDAHEIRNTLAGMSSLVRDRIELVEAHQMTPADYDKADIVFHPSLSESLPRVVLEAQSRGCRLVVADVGETSALVADDRRVLTDPSSVATMAADLVSAYEDVSSAAWRKVARPPRTVSAYVAELLKIVDATQVRRGRRA